MDMALHGGDRRSALARALVTTTIIQILSTITALALTPVAPTVASAFGVAPYWVGYQISAIYAAGAVSSAMAGTFVDRHGAVRIEQAALASYAIGLLALATGSFVAAALGSLAIGVGYGLQNPASSQILGAVAPPAKRSLVFSIKQAGVPVGGVVASLGFPILVPALGWRAALAMTALPSLAMIALLARDHAGERHVAPPHRALLAGFLAEQRLVWRSPPLRVLAMLGMLYSSIQLSLSAFTVTMLVTNGWGLLAAGMAAGIVQLSGAVGRVAWGMVADRTRSGLGVLAVIGFGSMACMVALYWLPVLPVPIVLAVLGVFGFCMSGWNGVLMAETTHHCAPADTGRVIGGTLVYTFLGVMIGPASFATLYDACRSYGLAFLLASVVAGCGAMLSLVAMRRPA